MSIIFEWELMCEVCKRTGKDPEDGRKKCSACAGLGGFTTLEGEIVLGFMRRHLSASKREKVKQDA